MEGLTTSCTPILHHPALLTGPAAMAEVLLKMEAAPAGSVSDRGVQKRKAMLGGSSLEPSQPPGSLTAEGKNTRRVEGNPAALGKPAPAEGFTLRNPDTGEGPVFQVPEESPHFPRRGKETPGLVMVHPRPRKGSPFLGHGIGKKNRIKTEGDGWVVGPQLSIQMVQPTFHKGKVVAGDNGTQTDLDMAFETCLEKTASPVPAAVAQKIMNFLGAIQAQLQEEPGMMKEIRGKGFKRNYAAGYDLHPLGGAQTGLQDLG